MQIGSSFIIFALAQCFGASSGEKNITKVANLDQGKSDSFNACGAVHIEKKFVLQSPNYPQNYPENSQCYYLLKGPHCPTHYKFEFLDFQLEESVNCTKDSLEIDKNILCGSKSKVDTYFAQNGSLRVKFKSDEDVTQKGYKILVTRLPCEKKATEDEREETTTSFGEATPNETQSKTTQHIESRILPNFLQDEQKCCSNNYNSKRFILTSPNFPYSLKQKTDCIYEIHRANQNVCRLRLNFLFFYLGYSNYNNCPYGHIEIDGKYLCGCNKDAKLTTTFDKGNVKILRFKTEGNLGNSNSGFVLEVIQDECPKKYSPENEGIGIYNDQLHKVAWPSGNGTQKNFVEKLQLINERTEILDDEDNIPEPKVIKSVYFFAAPDCNSVSRDRERSTYMEINSINSILSNGNYYECFSWNQAQYDFLIRRYGQNLQTCRKDSGASIESGISCTELDYVSGYFRSPGYPYYYPGNLNLCYRFRKQQGYCGIRMFMNDFQVQKSVNCVKDYALLTNGVRYCGNSLAKASWTIDLRNKDFEDMKFVTDDYYCGRGFSGVYQQITCQDMAFPINPVNHTPSPIPTPASPVHCDKFINDGSFMVTVDRGHRMCTFLIQKSSKDVCKINFHFEKFDLECNVESLIIDGMMFCGHLSGKIVTVNVNGDTQKIIYRSTLENKFDNLSLKIRGEQITDDCLILEVPAERLRSLPQVGTQTHKGKSLMSNGSLQKHPRYLVALLNKQFKDICGIVTNTTDKELPPMFCNILINEHNATKCEPLAENSIDVPYATKKITLTVKNDTSIAGLQEIEVHEIDCDNLK